MHGFLYLRNRIIPLFATGQGIMTTSLLRQATGPRIRKISFPSRITLEVLLRERVAATARGGYGSGARPRPVMRDPVVAANRHTYERAGAERRFARHGAVSMVTGAALPHRAHTHLVPNRRAAEPLALRFG